MNVTENRGESRFEVEVDGKVAGFVSYQRGKGVIAFMHTEIKDEFEGQGLGGKLVAGALDTAREEGLQVLPYCPFTRSYIAKHPEYLDLVPEDRRAEFELPGP
jgi:predicted GNAT family acetyltransferase